MKLYAINAGTFKLDGGAMFGVVPKVLWQKKYPADENNLCTWVMRCLLVDTGERKILIDTGIGDKQDEKFLKHYHPGKEETPEISLARYGFTCDDITDVIPSHLHFDHCGGGVKYNSEGTGFELTFKNARYWISKQQWGNAVKPNIREKVSILKENFLPIKDSGQLQLIEKDTEIYDGIILRLFNGHTDGLIVPFIKYGSRTVVFVSDLFPSTAHIPIPYVMAYDNQPLVTLKEKEEFLKEALENDYILFFGHDLYNECCSVQMTDKGIRVRDTFTLR
ncbi:MBL fold metallo-hydrolase [Fibrobacterota bacterium]